MYCSHRIFFFANELVLLLIQLEAWEGEAGTSENAARSLAERSQVSTEQICITTVRHFQLITRVFLNSSPFHPIRLSVGYALHTDPLPVSSKIAFFV